jgi:hypothetical protein
MYFCSSEISYNGLQLDAGQECIVQLLGFGRMILKKQTDENYSSACLAFKLLL